MSSNFVLALKFVAGSIIKINITLFYSTASSSSSSSSSQQGIEFVHVCSVIPRQVITATSIPWPSRRPIPPEIVVVVGTTVSCGERYVCVDYKICVSFYIAEVPACVSAPVIPPPPFKKKSLLCLRRNAPSQSRFWDFLRLTTHHWGRRVCDMKPDRCGDGTHKDGVSAVTEEVAAHGKNSVHGRVVNGIGNY